LKSYPGELVDAIIYGRDLGQDDDFVSEERFDKIRFYLKNGKYPNGADRAEKSRLRSAATHYKLYPAAGSKPERLMLKGKEVISDPQRQYEIARELHHKSHGGINKTTASIAESYHWVRIKETVSQVIRNCSECSEMNKGLSTVRGQQPRYIQSSDSPRLISIHTPVQHFQQQQASLERADSPSNQLQMESGQQQLESFANFQPEHNDFGMPVDPALMDGMRPPSLEDLPPSPFLAAAQEASQNPDASQIPNIGLPTQDSTNIPQLSIDSTMSGTEERAPTASLELRRRLTRAGFNRGQV
jgi:hypothetical protein